MWETRTCRACAARWCASRERLAAVTVQFPRAASPGEPLQLSQAFACNIASVVPPESLAVLSLRNERTLHRPRCTDRSGQPARRRRPMSLGHLHRDLNTSRTISTMRNTSGTRSAIAATASRYLLIIRRTIHARFPIAATASRHILVASGHQSEERHLPQLLETTPLRHAAQHRRGAPCLTTHRCTS